jgi:hypothetical protein
MSDREERRSEDLSAIDEVVRLQQRLALRWARYAAESVESLQAGKMDAGAWLGAYGRFAADATDDFVATMQAMSRLRGPW